MSGHRVLLTRDVRSAPEWIQPMRRIGVRLEGCNILRFEALPVDVDQALDGAGWIVLTSANGARFFRDALERASRSPQALPPVAVVGEATARRARALGLPVGRVGPGGAAELCSEMIRDEAPGVLVWVRPQQAHAEPFAAMEASGFTVRSLVAYRTLPADDLDPLAERIRAGDFDAIVFTAPSAFHALHGVAGEAMSTLRRVALGRTTARALQAADLPAHAVAERPDPEAVAGALERLLLC